MHSVFSRQKQRHLVHICSCSRSLIDEFPLNANLLEISSITRPKSLSVSLWWRLPISWETCNCTYFNKPSRMSCCLGKNNPLLNKISVFPAAKKIDMPFIFWELPVYFFEWNFLEVWSSFIWFVYFSSVVENVGEFHCDVSDDSKQKNAANLEILSWGRFSV